MASRPIPKQHKFHFIPDPLTPSKNSHQESEILQTPGCLHVTKWLMALDFFLKKTQTFILNYICLTPSSHSLPPPPSKALLFLLPLKTQQLYFIMCSQLSGKSPFLLPWQTVCQLNSPCHVSLPLPTHARRPSLLQLPLAPSATFVIDHWSNPVPTCSSSAYTSNEVLVV